MTYKHLLTLLFACMCCAAISATIEFPGDGTAYDVSNAAARRQSASSAKTPDGADALKISWGAYGSGSGAFASQPSHVLPLGFAKFTTVSRLYLPEKSGLKSFNLRVEDASGETFQFYRFTPAGKSGWISITNVIDLAHPPKGSWGGNADKTMDLPLKITGAGFEFNNYPQTSHYYIAAIDYAAEDETPATRRRIELGDAGESAYVNQAADRNQASEIVAMPDGTKAMRIGWNATANRNFELYFKDGIPLGSIGSAIVRARIFLSAKGTLKMMNLRLRDAEGETLQYSHGIPPDAEGWHNIVFTFNVAAKAPVAWGGPDDNKAIDLPASIQCLTGEFVQPSGASGWMGIEYVDVENSPSFAPLEPRLETGSPIGILRKGDESKLGWSIENTKDMPVTAKLAWRVEDVLGNLVQSNAAPISIAPGGTAFAPMDAPGKMGINYVTLTYAEESPGVRPLSLHRNFAYMDPAGPTQGKGEGFIFGVCSHSQWKPAAEQEMQALAASLCGVKVLREDTLWERMEPQQGKWNFKFFDSVVEVFGRHGIEVAPIYCYRPDWAVAKDWKPLKPESPRGKRPDYAHWANFVRTVAERYRDNVRYVEVWNEPDLLGYANFTAEEYIEMLKIAYAETKKAAPDVTVLTGGFTKMPPFLNINDPRHMEKTLVQGKGSYDVQAFHVHGTFEAYRDQVDKLLDLRRGLGITTPWWANETAITATGNGEYVQAKVLFQKFIYTWARGAMGYNWFSLCNAGNDPNNGEHNFGLLTKDFQPKAAYPVYNTIARYLTGAEYLRDMELGTASDSFLFRAKNGDFIIAHWNNDVDMPVRPLAISGATGEAHAVDMFGNETPLLVLDGCVVFNSSTEPGFVRISRQSAPPKEAAPPLALQSRAAIIPGETGDIEMTLHNPSTSPLKATVALTPPAGITTADKTISIDIAPGGSASVKIPLTADATFQSAGQASQSMRIDVVVEPLWSGSFSSRINSAVMIPLSESGKFAEAPTFVLDDISQQTKLVPDAPDLEHLRWKGPEDQSAKVWLAFDNGRGILMLKAEVVDDVHRQPNTGEDVFYSDGLQVALQPSGEKGFWEIGMSRHDDGTAQVHIWSAPTSQASDHEIKSITLNVTRDEAAKTTSYIAEIPAAIFGLDSGGDFGFDILVNDDDTGRREGFMELVPGIGIKKDPDAFIRIVFPSPTPK